MKNKPIGNDPSAFTKLLGIPMNVKGARIIGDSDSYNVNVFKVIGSVRILEQYALITSITNLTNMTDIYADLWDGSNSVKLTSGNPGGAVLSGAPVGSMFYKDLESDQVYTVNLADEVRMGEPDNKRIGRPFIVTQKFDTDTFIRFNYTTNTVLDFVMDIYFTYENLDGGCLELV